MYAFVRPPGGWCLDNPGILTGGVLIDTAATETRARLPRAAADAVTERPVHTVVNTHVHGDHTFGNGLVGGGMTIIAHELARHDMAVTGHGRTRLWPEVAWGRVAPDLPTITFTTGSPCTGAIRSSNWCTSARRTPPAMSWRGCPTSACPAGGVCGHGPVAGPEVLDTVDSYLALVHRLAVRGVVAGYDHAARDADLDGFGMLRDSERLVAKPHRAYAELHGAAPGEPLDVLAVHRDMAEYRGERIISLA